MKFKPGYFFIQHQVLAEVTIYQVGDRTGDVCRKEFFRNQVALRKIIDKKNLTRLKTAQYGIVTKIPRRMISGSLVLTWGH